MTTPAINTGPLFSIAMPVRNGQNYLAAAVESVRAQTYPHWELVVSDNASTDATPKILADFARRDTRISVSRSDQVLAPTANFNRAGGLGRGQWVVFLCHDDVLKPNALERITTAVGRFPSGRLALVSYGAEYEFDTGHVAPPAGAAATERYFDGRQFLRVALGGRVPAALPMMSQAAVRMDVWRGLGGFDARYLHSDTFLWYRLLVDHDTAVIPDVLLRIRIHRGQDSASVRRQHRSIAEYRAFFPEFVRRYGTELDLPWRTRLVAPTRFLSVAATEIVIQLFRRDFGRALEVAGRVPVVWHALLAALCVRNGLAELRRSRNYRDRVPAHLIYP